MKIIEIFWWSRYHTLVENEKEFELQKSQKVTTAFFPQQYFSHHPNYGTVMQFGKVNLARIYTVNCRALESVAERSSLKAATLIDKMVKVAYGMLAFMNQDIEYKS